MPATDAFDETTPQGLPDASGEGSRHAPAPEEWIGSSVSHYEIGEKIGTGGMGVVYRAYDTRLLRPVALKFLPPSGDSVAKERFLKEAQAASTLDHPNIATVYELGETTSGQLFFAMACYEGETLDVTLQRGPCPIEQVVLVATQAAAGLARAHRRGIVHRDIKPANLMITADGIVKILDFGIAKKVGHEGPTLDGSLVATPAYMSPEQAAGEAVDHRTDLWSLGVVLYAMLAGHPPFQADNLLLLAKAILFQQPEKLRRLRPEIPLALERLVERMLEKDPDQRPQSAQDVLAALGSSTTAQEIPPPTTSRYLRRWRQWAAGTTVGLLVTALAALTLVMVHERGVSPPQVSPAGQRPSIAVLPFENLSRDATQDYMADGLTEALTTALAKIGGLKVVSRTSAAYYRTAAKPLPQIAAELGVDDVLEGGILRVGDRVRITVKLIEARTDRSLWAETYDRGIDDILELQGEVARAIVRATQVQLTPQELAGLTPSRAVEPRVYEAYLQGRYHWNKRDREGLERAIGYFEQAIAHDPAYAPAYAGLADAYAFLSTHLRVSPELSAKARAAAEKAVALDDLLPEAHASLGNLMFNQDLDLAGSEKELRRAIELNPNYAAAHLWLWINLLLRERWDEAQREIELARELDPHSLVIQTAYAEQLRFMGKEAAWEAEVRNVLGKDPGFRPMRIELAQYAVGQGRLDEACTQYQKVLVADGREELALRMGRTREQQGAQAAFAEAAQTLAELEPHVPIPASEIAMLYLAAGQKTETFAWLEKAYQQRSPDLLSLKVWPTWQSLRTDPRFADLQRRVSLPRAGRSPDGKKPF